MCPVEIRGKFYKTVSERLQEFHTDHKDGSVITQLLSCEDKNTFMFKAEVSFKGGETTRIFTGHASETAGEGYINKTSALENAETSSIGRALASAGYAGSEFASANEVENAQRQPKSNSTLPNTATKTNGDKITPPQERMIKALLDKVGMTTDQFLKEHNIQSLQDLSKRQASEVITDLKGVSDG